jgi:hypothetical protein
MVINLPFQKMGLDGVEAECLPQADIESLMNGKPVSDSLQQRDRAGYRAKIDTEGEGERAKPKKSNGRPVGTRTPDLYRVKRPVN